MKKRRLTSFHNLELKIWGDKCETNPYFATISILFLAVFGCIIGGDATMNFVSGDRILESVDGKIFFYTAGETYESTQRLYQLEEMLAKTTFARISKTAIANLSKMRSIKPMHGSRLEASMVNGEKVQVSRAYVQEIKRKLGV